MLYRAILNTATKSRIFRNTFFPFIHVYSVGIFSSFFLCFPREIGVSKKGSYPQINHRERWNSFKYFNGGFHNLRCR